LSTEALEHTGVPSPEFTVLDARPDRSAGVPTLKFNLDIAETSGLLVYTIALHVQVHLEPARREHDEETRARMLELFGTPERWSKTAGTVPWMAVDALVPSFTGRTTFTLAFPCGYDHEVAATRYCGALREGTVPLDLHFNGMVYHRGEDGRLQMVLIPWSAVTRFDLPWEVWRDAMRGYYPTGGWVALESDTMDRLTAYRADHGLKSYDQVIKDLLP
jgi:hypothetical protein